MRLSSALRRQASTTARYNKYVYLTSIRLRHQRRATFAGEGTDIVIEGYPRSANTFAYAHFVLANGETSRIAAHHHAPIQFDVARRLGVPAILLVRRPDDAAISLAIFDQRWSLKAALNEYTRFHQRVSRHANYPVISDFTTTTEAFDRVIERVNARWGTNFHALPRSPESIQRCFDYIDAHAALAGTMDDRKLGRPTTGRDSFKQGLRKQLESRTLKGRLEKCWELYRTLARLSV